MVAAYTYGWIFGIQMVYSMLSMVIEYFMMQGVDWMQNHQVSLKGRSVNGYLLGLKVWLTFKVIKLPLVKLGVSNKPLWMVSKSNSYTSRETWEAIQEKQPRVEW
jgi:hypothetical protein